jgi:hypothetical protein
MRARGLALGQEFKGKGVNIALGPMMNMGRVAQGGRNWEGFGADPFLTGESAYETILGLQNGGVQATAKHFINKFVFCRACLHLYSSVLVSRSTSALQNLRMSMTGLNMKFTRTRSCAASWPEFRPLCAVTVSLNRVFCEPYHARPDPQTSSTKPTHATTTRC